MNIKNSTKEDDIIMDHCYLFCYLGPMHMDSKLPFLRSILPFFITPSNSQRPWIASSFRIGIPLLLYTKRLIAAVDELAPYAPDTTRRCPTSSNLSVPAVCLDPDLKFEKNLPPHDPPSSLVVKQRQHHAIVIVRCHR